MTASAVNDSRYGRLSFRLEPCTALSIAEGATVDLPLAVFGGRSHLHSPVGLGSDEEMSRADGSITADDLLRSDGEQHGPDGEADRHLGRRARRPTLPASHA